ncbi:MAG: outer membrane lipoprotein-sorting protein [Gammaproteobacteria bacterium]|nr:outer membrane lipoprotein-sorting protein [Gammaproteobacteria bacterium]
MFASTIATERFFQRVTSRPYRVLIAAGLAIVICGAGLTKLVKDTSVKAFIPAGHEALLTDSKAAETFGISDTIAVAIVTTDGSSVFRPDVLSLISKLSDQVASLPNIRYDRISSLATESSINGDGGAVNIDPYIDPYVLDDSSASSSRRRWEKMAPHKGTLVSEDGGGAIIMAELVDSDVADATYQAVFDIVASVDVAGVDLHVAGPGAVSGYLSRYIDKDARKLQPLVFVVVLGFIFLAFRRGSALPGPLLVVVGSAVGSLGIMAWSGISYFAITNALPVIIVAISVADAIHILSAYYQFREQDDQASIRDLVVRAMGSMARPITLTTITTIAGFLGIAVMSVMPPITYFGIFASLGVLLAWTFSIFVLPNVMLLVNPGRSPAFVSWHEGRPSGLGQLLAKVGTFSPLRYRSVLVVFLFMTIAAGYGAAQLRIDRSQVENFAADEPIRVADELINERFAGTAFLDVIVETDEPEGLLQVDNMRKVRNLQLFFEALPHVRKTVSIVDYVSQLHGAIEELSETEISARSLPDSDAALAETLFVYEISGDPTDLDEEIDADHRRALIRGVLDAHYFSQNRVAVESLQHYIDESFNEPGLTASLTGDVNVSYHWMRSLQTSHFKGVILSLTLVLAASILVFRSPVAGLVSVVPVMFTVLVLYACMGYLGIYLEPATSMFAAIALGVGVDFAIHLVDRLRTAAEEYDGDLAKAIDRALPPVARACFFNSAALGLGFSVLLVSDLPTLMRFGGLVTLASFASYLTALVIVPAMFAAERDWFGRSPGPAHPSRVPVSVLLMAAVVAGLLSGDAIAATKDADRIAEAIAARTEGTATKRVIDMTLTNGRGRSEKRIAIVHKQSDEELRATRITFLEPKKSRDVSFLSHDYRTPGSADKRWMFLPAARKVRRVPASQRGKSFLGTDFSYEDMQSELKFKLSDWQFEYGGQLIEDGRVRHRLTGTPKNPRIARELGYGGFDALIDEDTWMPVAIDFVDAKQRPLKTIDVRSIVQIGDIWTARNIVATNHQTGHTTEFAFRNIDYHTNLDNRLFEPQTLGRGLGATAKE